MKIITIYHNPQCSKSQKALEILNKSNHNIEVIDYLKVGLSTQDIKAICESLGVKPTKIIRTKEKIYQTIAKTFEDADNDQQYKIIAENLILLERPIVMTYDKAIIARPPEKIKQMLE